MPVSACSEAPAFLPANAVATDSEWDHHWKDTPYGSWLSTTFASLRGVVIYVREDLPDDTRARLKTEARRLGVRLYPVGRFDDAPLLLGTLPDLVDGYSRGLGGEHPRPDDAPALPKTALLFYFSPKDIEYAAGWAAWRKAIETGRVRQHNHLAGSIDGWLQLRDLSGWPGKERLAKFAAAVGVPMEEKTSMDAYKSNMAQGLLERPEDFLRYAVEDARVLLHVYQRFVHLFRTVQGRLGFPEPLRWTGEDIPLSCGRLVAETFRRWATLQAGEYAEAVEFCCKKLGYLDRDQRSYEAHREDRAALVVAARSPEQFSDITADPVLSKILRQHDGARYVFTALDGCGVRWWASQRATETAPLNALVHGGRCNNERPDEHRTGPGADIDIVGCYGDALRNLTYPVGLPSVWSWQSNEKPPELGRWLRRHGAELVDGLWTCTVRGKLPFEQDLLVSCLVKVESIRRAADPDGGDIPHDMVLMRRELSNAIITSDLLRALRQVATNRELAALMKLEVVTAAAYLRRHRRDGAEGWCREVMTAPDEAAAVRLEAGTPSDRRSRAWYDIPLEGFVGTLAEERKRCKQTARSTTDEQVRQEAEGMGRVLKLMVNTLYGSLVCRHFAIGNTVVANNITARARLGVWMLAKALGLRQTITDGGIYTPGAVPHLGPNCKRPGLGTLSRPEDWATPKLGRTIRPLGGHDWQPGPLPPDADALALAHVRQFWSAYGLEPPFTALEHKHDRVFLRAAYVNKADYALLFDEGRKPVYAVRGMQRVRREDGGQGRRHHPTFALLDAILAGTDAFPDDLTYRRSGLLKVGMYRLAQGSATGFAKLKDLRPGDDLPEEEYTARYNNTHMRVADEATFRRRHDRKRTARGVAVEFFERHRAGGIARVFGRMRGDNLR